MKLILGAAFIILSAIGTLFFRHYSGKLIQYPIFWYTIFLLLGLLGIWLILSSFNKEKEKEDFAYISEIKKLKAKSKRIDLNFDLCEFNSSSYSHQVKDPNLDSVEYITPGRMQPLVDTTITENVHQSYLIYNYTSGDKIERYISQPFPFDVETLKFYTISNKITLYIDQFDRKRFYFELKK